MRNDDRRRWALKPVSESYLSEIRQAAEDMVSTLGEVNNE